jgi:small subunit ribosomal protein S18
MGDPRDRDLDDHMDRGDRDDDLRGGRSSFKRRKVCRFCGEKDTVIDYRDASAMRLFISERGKIVPRRISGNCAKHQREVTVAVRRGRALALLPYVVTGA